MAKRYGHIGELAQRQAVEILDRKDEKKHRDGRRRTARKKQIPAGSTNSGELIS
jgi:hypothetical protein